MTIQYHFQVKKVYIFLFIPIVLLFTKGKQYNAVLKLNLKYLNIRVNLNLTVLI